MREEDNTTRQYYAVELQPIRMLLLFHPLGEMRRDRQHSGVGRNCLRALSLLRLGQDDFKSMQR